MQRQKFNNIRPDLILTADWHLREDLPVCRTDNFWKAQWRKVDFVRQLQQEHGCPIIHSGDLFNHWKPSPFLLSETIKHLPDKFYTIYGNHDLPQHNLELADKCGIYVLLNANTVKLLEGTHWGELPTRTSYAYSFWNTFSGKNEFNRKILVWHVMTYMKKPWPDCTDPLATKLLRQYPQYDLIVTGHNHQAFWTEEEERLLVNPGSLTRQSAAQIEFKPRVYLWYASSNSVSPVYLPIEEDVISRDHIDAANQRDDRIDAFISQLQGDWKVGMSFEENLEEFQKANTISDSVMNIVYKMIE